MVEQSLLESVATVAADEEETEVVLEDTGLTAVALYDYQAAAEDEISFDPDDLITHVEMVNYKIINLVFFSFCTKK